MHYQFKQDLAMAYFDGCSKKTASRLLAREINLTPGLLDALRPTGYRPAQKRLSPRQLQILFLTSTMRHPSHTRMYTHTDF